MQTNKLQHQFVKYLETVDNATEEVKAAQTIQQMLLDGEVPQCKELSCAGVSIPAYRLSGDYYDFIYDEQNGRYWILIGDVMGKGIPASLMMVMMRSTVKVLTGYSSTPSELLFALNNYLFKDLTRLRAFSTLFCGMFDIHSSEFRYASAGHPSAIFMKKSEENALRLESKGTIIGVMQNRQYQDYSVILSKGDLLVLCTDGILEAMDIEKKQYGYDRLMQVIGDNKEIDPSRLIQKIIEDVRQYSKDYRRDDLTIVAVRCEKGV